MNLSFGAVSSGSVEVNWTQPVSVPPQSRAVTTASPVPAAMVSTLPHHNMWLHQQWMRAHTYTWSSVVSCQTPLTPAVCLHTLNWAPVIMCVTLSSQVTVCQSIHAKVNFCYWKHCNHILKMEYSKYCFRQTDGFYCVPSLISGAASTIIYCWYWCNTMQCSGYEFSCSCMSL